MYSTHNEGKSVAAEIFIKTLKNKIYKYMTSLSEDVHIDKFDDLLNKHNSTVIMQKGDKLCASSVRTMGHWRLAPLITNG